MYQLCKSLFMSGVTRRFPTLNLGFLECGVAWACSLLADLVEHWEKRNLKALAHLDPAAIDHAALVDWFQRYGGDLLAGVGDLEKAVGLVPTPGVAPDERDDWRHLRIERPAELVELFAPRLFFGCEADDRTIAFAFSSANPYGATLRPVFSSDIAHWDVPDMAAVVAESHGLVEHGVLTAEQYRAFVFDNPVELFRGANPDFFTGTAVELTAAHH